jgi:hypothetical protein
MNKLSLSRSVGEQWRKRLGEKDKKVPSWDLIALWRGNRKSQKFLCGGLVFVAPNRFSGEVTRVE